MSKTYTICTVIRSIKIEYLEAKDSKKFTETFERYESLETCLKWAFYMKHCAALTPSFKVRILIPLPRGKQLPLGVCFLLLRRSKDSKNPYCKATRLLGTCSKSMILVTGNVLITSKASNKVLGHLFKIFDFGNG